MGSLVRSTVIDQSVKVAYGACSRNSGFQPIDGSKLKNPPKSSRSGRNFYPLNVESMKVVRRISWLSPKIFFATNATAGYRFSHTDVISKQPNFDYYRRGSTLDPTKRAEETIDARRVSTYISYGVGGIISLYMAKQGAVAFAQYKGPNRSMLAMASVEINLSEIPEGKGVTTLWRGKPVFIRHRTGEEIERERAVNVKELRDPQHDNDRVTRPEWLVVLGVCTHLGCVPIAGLGNFGGYYCPCHGSHYDASGRIRQGPAPLNLEVPQHTFVNDKTLGSDHGFIMDTVVSTLNTRVLKEPLGFIRVLEFPLAILAFATTAGYSASTYITVTCPEKQNTIELSWAYPFNLHNVKVPTNLCNATTEQTGYISVFGTSPVSQSQFFVCTGVLCFLYILVILGIYLMAWRNYENDARYPLGDMVITAVLAVFWFIASCAWASGLSTLKSYDDSDSIDKRLAGDAGPYPCAKTALCKVDQSRLWNYASLNVSLIAGFACFGLWAANLWFIYKETAWYKARKATNVSGPGSGVAGSPSNAGGTTFR